MPLELSHCCFCFQLRTGSLIIGYLSLFLNVNLAVAIIHALATSDSGGDDKKNKNNLLLYVHIVLVCINFVFIIILLIGIYKGKREFVKTYLVFNALYIIFYAIVFLIGLIYGPKLLMIFAEIINILINVYFFLVIRSYYLKML